MLDGLKERLLAPDLVAEFVTTVQEELGQARKRREADGRRRDRKVAEIERKIAAVMRAIEDGLYEPVMKERMAALKAEKAVIEHGADADRELDLAVLLHPRLPELYRRKVEALERVLEGPDRAEAMDLIRSMIERVDLTPRAEGSELDAVLHGDLAPSWRRARKRPQKANSPEPKGVRGVN